MSLWLIRQAHAAADHWHAERIPRTVWMLLMHGLLLAVTFPYFCAVVSFVYLLIGGMALPDAWGWASGVRPYEHVGNVRVIFSYALLMTVSVLAILYLRRLAHRIRHREWFGYHLTVAAVLPVIVILNIAPLPFELRHAATFVLSFLALTGLFNRRKPAGQDYFFINSSLTISVTALLLFSGDEYVRLVSLPALAAFACVWYLPPCIPTIRMHSRAWIGLLMCALFVCLFITQSDVGNVGTHHHYGFFLGPVIELLYGGRLPFVDLFTQYGTGLTVALAGYFRLIGFVSPDAMLMLIKLLAFAQYVLIYVITASVCRSRTAGALAMISAVCFTYISQGIIVYSAPSVGFLRFGIIWLMLLAMTLRGKRNSFRGFSEWATAALAAVATLWSFDLLIYIVPPMIALFLLRGEYRRLLMWLARFALSLIIFGSLLLLPAVLSGSHIDLSLHWMYAIHYAGGFGLISVYRRELFWMLFPALYLFVIARQAFVKEQDERLTLIALYGLAAFLYFIGRAAANNLAHVSLPFIVLSFWLASRSSWSRRLALASVTAVFVSAFAMSDIVRGTQAPVSLPDLARINPASPDFFLKQSAFRSRYCPPEIELLRPYVRDGKLPLLSMRDDAYLFYACLGVGNTFGMNPYVMAVFHPLAAAQSLERIRHSDSPVILIQRSRYEIVSRNVVPDFETFLDDAVRVTGAEKTDEFDIAGEGVEVYERSPK